MDQISESNLTDKNFAECSLNKVSLETELSETLYNTCLLYTSDAADES